MMRPSEGLAYPPMRLAWTMWGLGAAFYFIGFYQRVAPAVMTSELTEAFGLTAATLGNLSAFYFYSYVAMQIPTGVLVDRFGPRWLLAVGAVVAAIGTVVFAVATTQLWANMGRMLIGASVGVAFVSMLKLASHWMPPRQFALTSAVALAVGVLGAVSAGAPLRLLIDAFGWRTVMWASAACTLVVAALAARYVRDDPSARGYASYTTEAVGLHTNLLAGLREVLRARNVSLLLVIPGAASGSVLTFAGLWGVPFLTTHYGLTQTNAAGLCSVMMVAWALGCLAYGAASDRHGQRKPLFIGGMMGTLALWALLIFVPQLPYVALVAVIAAIGFFAACFILSFVFAKESVPARLAGTASGVANMGVIMGPMLLQPLAGLILDWRWQGVSVGGKRVFDLVSYQQAFSLILIWGVVSLLLLALTRETFCRQADDA